MGFGVSVLTNARYLPGNANVGLVRLDVELCENVQRQSSDEFQLVQRQQVGTAARGARDQAGISEIPIAVRAIRTEVVLAIFNSSAGSGH